MSKPIYELMCGDCLSELRSEFGAGEVDLIVTSPPYADNRKSTYPGIKPEEYVEWFLHRADQFYRVLNKRGTFILNIKERVQHGERGTYVMELVQRLRNRGWFFTEEWIWHKTNSFPGKWPNRFRDAWEHIYQFNKSKDFSMFQDSVKVPIGDWAKTRMKKLSATDRVRDESKVESGFGKRVANWEGRKMVYPDNVLYFATVCENTGHSAAFPEELPAFFIKLFTRKGDTVLDPFMGSGTTVAAALKLERRAVGIDTERKYITSTRNRLKTEGLI